MPRWGRGAHCRWPGAPYCLIRLRKHLFTLRPPVGALRVGIASGGSCAVPASTNGGLTVPPCVARGPSQGLSASPKPAPGPPSKLDMSRGVASAAASSLSLGSSGARPGSPPIGGSTRPGAGAWRQGGRPLVFVGIATGQICGDPKRVFPRKRSQAEIVAQQSREKQRWQLQQELQLQKCTQRAAPATRRGTCEKCRFLRFDFSGGVGSV